MTQEEVNEIIENHQHYLHRDCDNWENMRADFGGADLYNLDLSNANLDGANLHNANLSYANLSDANLCCADLDGAILNGANLRGAYLRGANFCNANLCNVYLYGADLYGAVLRGADLRFANLSNTNLHNAQLDGANLDNISLDENEKIRQGIILTESMTGWKKCANDVLVKLEISASAVVFSINNGKCRTNKAIVKEIIDSDRAYSNYKFFSYYVGDVINIKDFNCKYNVECGEGIHFFRTREEAEAYIF